MAKLTVLNQRQLEVLLNNKDAAKAVVEFFDSVSQIAAMTGSDVVEGMLENVIENKKTRNTVAQAVYKWAKLLVGDVNEEDAFVDSKLNALIGVKYAEYAKTVFGNWREVYAMGKEDLVVAALSLIVKDEDRRKVANRLYTFATAKYAKPVNTGGGQSGGVNIIGGLVNHTGDIVGRDLIKK